jgi:hypothetical protein
MLDWLDATTPINPDYSAPVETGHVSGEVRGLPIFPVSRFLISPPGLEKHPANPHEYRVFPVSRFSRFQNKGGPDNEAINHAETNAQNAPIPEHLPALLDAVAAHVSAPELDHLRTLSDTDPDTVANACRLILTGSTFPTVEAVAELDGLMVRLCGLVPWLAGFLPEMQAARYRMAPADVADNLYRFRRWVSKAEEQGQAARLGAGC